MEKFSNISIRKKLILLQATTAFIALIICCSLFVFNGIATFRLSAQRKMQSIARIIGANSVSALMFMDQDADSVLLYKLHQETDIIDAVVLDKKGQVFASFYRPGAPRENYNFNFPKPDEGEMITSEFSGDKLLVKYKIFNDKVFLGTIVIRSELGDLKLILRNYIMVATLVLIAGLITAVIISLFLEKTISKRLLALVSKTREIADSHNYAVHIPAEGRDEIAVLSKEFNALLLQINTMETSLKNANAELEVRVQQRTVELETANKELESFSYSVSHDLKAPLRAINGFTEILVKKYADKIDDKGKELARVIVANGKKMGQLIEDLLEFSRIGRREMVFTEVSMDEILQMALTDAMNMNKTRNIVINKEKLPPALGDRSLLVQVWTNLISNAIKYTGHKEKAEITIGSYEEDGRNIYFIKDNGAGFDMKYKDKLFKVFQRLHGSDEFEGTGIGLANVSRIITRHGGTIWTEAKVNEGAAFYFSLPVVNRKGVPEILLKTSVN